MSIQFDMQHLLSENPESRVTFTINDDKLYDLLQSDEAIIDDLDYEPNEQISLNKFNYDRFTDLAMSAGYVEGKHFSRVGDIEEEGSSSSGAFLPSLHASPKQYKGPELKESQDKEPKLAAGKANVYMKKKWGWKNAPSIPNRPSKGGFIYTQLLERDLTKGVDANGKEIKIGDEVKVLNLKDGHGVVTAFDEDQIIITITKGGGSTHERPNTPMFPKQIEKIEKDEEKQDDTDLKEGYKRDIKVRNESQQLKEATRLVKRKLKEVNSILEYAKHLKSGLNENECESCSRMMESIKVSIAEAYKKMKEL